MFSLRVYEETAPCAPIIGDTLLPVTILIEQDRGKVEHTISLIIDQSEICLLAAIAAMKEEEVD